MLHQVVPGFIHYFLSSLFLVTKSLQAVLKKYAFLFLTQYFGIESLLEEYEKLIPVAKFWVSFCSFTLLSVGGSEIVVLPALTSCGGTYARACPRRPWTWCPAGWGTAGTGSPGATRLAWDLVHKVIPWRERECHGHSGEGGSFQECSSPCTTYPAKSWFRGWVDVNSWELAESTD